VAGTVASEWQLTGNMSLDDGSQAAISSKRLSSRDPNPVSGPKLKAVGRSWANGRDSLS